MSHIVLLGLMGAGKTELGRRVAERLDLPLLDGDDVLEERTGQTARQVADDSGLDALHQLEAEIALEMIATASPAVIGPAASVIEVDAVRDALVGHLVVWLTGPPELLGEMAGGKDHRPLVNETDAVALAAEQLATRQPLAVAVADLVLDISASPRDEQAEAIVALARSRHPSLG